MYNYLNEFGKFVKPKLSNVLTNAAKKRRLYDCNKMSTHNFNNIIFSDESMIELHRNSIKLFKPHGCHLIKRKLQTKIKIMVWGAISMKGKIDFHIVPQNVKVNSEYYCKNILSPFFKKVSEIHKKWYFLKTMHHLMFLAQL